MTKKKRNKKRDELILGLIGLMALLIVFALPEIISAASSGFDANASLTIWTIGTPNAENMTYGPNAVTGKNINFWNFHFYANFTNSSGFILNDSFANCSIRFNETGVFSDWSIMGFNSSISLWQFNRSFVYKGNLSFQGNCTSDYGNVTNLTDIFKIRNTPPTKKDATTITYNDFEDNYSSHNFSIYILEDDYNDILNYHFENVTSTKYNDTSPSFYYWLSMESSAGIIHANATNNSEADNFVVTIHVVDSEEVGVITPVELNLQPVNDAPVFHNLSNEVMNISPSHFEKTITITDEENDIPFKLNITFINCTTAPFSSRNSINCTLFNETQWSFNDTSGILNISFTPVKDDVGVYNINFTVSDSGNDYAPFNATNSQVVTYEVLNTNSAPIFTFICNDKRSGTEDSEFSCRINASDVDEINNLTFSSNYTWFTFSNSQNVITVPIAGIGQNVSAVVNFTPGDLQVGNWSVNISVRDTGSPLGIVSTNQWFYINNTEDPVYLDTINDMVIYEDNTSYVKAFDDDLLVPDKSIKNEILTFASNTSWVSVSSNSSALNYTTARIFINFNAVTTGNYSVRINVTDTTENFAERNFTIQVLGDIPFQWNQTSYAFTFYENQTAYLNLSQYGNDSDIPPDLITFSYTSDTAFLNFPGSISNGIINFTPDNVDVGQHILTINGYDQKLNSFSQFNLTILNVNNGPLILRPLSVSNASADSQSNINTSEDNHTEIRFFVEDLDFKIPLSQIGFYNESLNLNLTIQGRNPNLFSFNLFDENRINGRVEYKTSFTANKSDVGTYNVTINVTDKSNASDTLEFKLIIFEVGHAPVLSRIGNETKAINETLYIDFNATDVEDINETFGNLTYSIENLTTNGNFLAINSTFGIINITLNESEAGVWEFNVIVNDSAGMTDSQIFKLTVYDYPEVAYPPLDTIFNLKENVSSELIFSFNHSVGMILNDSLNYTVFINNKFKNNTLAVGNGENSSIYIAPDFTEETTCTGPVNLTVNISNLLLNNVFNWNVTINHTSSPLIFSGTINDKSGINSVTINLSTNFIDADATDLCTKQIVGFTSKAIEGTESGGIISVSITNMTNATEEGSIIFTATATSTAMFTVVGYEYEGSSYNGSILSNITSNNFTISISVSNPEIRTTTVTRTQLAIIKIVLPDPVSAEIGERIVLPITLINQGQIMLRGINLFNSVAKDGVLVNDVPSFFSIEHLDSLAPGQSQDINLTIDITTKYKGIYELTINATVDNPILNDWGKIYLDVREGVKIEKLILFIDELIASNPQCIEIKELVNEAKSLIDSGNLAAGEAKINEAITACQAAITQAPLASVRKPPYEALMNYVVISSVVAFGLGLVYYYYRRIRMG